METTKRASLAKGGQIVGRGRRPHAYRCIGVGPTPRFVPLGGDVSEMPVLESIKLVEDRNRNVF